MRAARAPRGPALAPFLLVATTACGGIPDPPAASPVPAEPRPAPVRVDLSASIAPAALRAPEPVVPRIRWRPARPAEGTLVSLLIEPQPAGLPFLEARARSQERELPLVPLGAGGYLALVPARLNEAEIPLTVEVTFVDGTRLSARRAIPVYTREFPSTSLSVARRFTAPDRATLERIRRERVLVRRVLDTATDKLLLEGPFVLPRSDVYTSPYGQRRLFNGELRSRHTGLDIDGDRGDPIYAANTGRVALARDLFFTGNCVYLDHGLGLYTGYFHMSEILVREGEWVEKGQLIGRVGATGRVTGPHLHWALYLHGSPLDPLSAFDAGIEEVSQRLAALPTGSGAANP